MKITEGILGYWHYHLSEDDSPLKGLCGRQVMPTNMQLKDWGVPFGKHFSKRQTWCKKCEQIKAEKKK